MGAEGAVKKQKPYDVTESPAQTGSSKSPATSKQGKPVISCKSCGGGFVNLKIHLGKSASCRSKYGSEVESSENSKPLAGVSKASGVNKSHQSKVSNMFEILEDGVEDTCKVCGEGFKRLMRHLRESASCGKEYGDLDQLAKEVSKAKDAARKKRRRDNLKKVDKEAVLKGEASRKKK